MEYIILKNYIHKKNLCSKVVKVIEPEPGNWTVKVGSDEDYSVKVVGQSNLTFEYGFSTFKPTSMSNTTYRPLQGNIISISVI